MIDTFRHIGARSIFISAIGIEKKMIVDIISTIEIVSIVNFPNFNDFVTIIEAMNSFRVIVRQANDLQTDDIPVHGKTKRKTTIYG